MTIDIINDIINPKEAKTYDPSAFGYDYDLGDEATTTTTQHKKPSPGILLDLLQLREKARAIKRVYLAGEWLQAGHLSVLSGREKRGKSTCVYDLMTALISGQSWMDTIPCVKSPVLLLDFENPADYVSLNLENMLEQRNVDIEEVSRYYGQVDPDEIRNELAPVAAEYVADLIRMMGEKIGSDQPGLLVIDTAAPAWMDLFNDPNWTNTNTQVRKALEIGQRIARSTNWHVMVLYHDNKSGSGASGSYEWYGTPDVFLRFERELNDSKGYLSIFGRLLNPPDPVEFTRRDHLLYAQPKGAEAAKSKKEEEDQDFLNFLQTLPKGKENARIQGDLLEDARKTFQLANGQFIPKNKVLGFLNRAEQNGLAKTYQSAANKPKSYWLEKGLLGT